MGKVGWSVGLTPMSRRDQGDGEAVKNAVWRTLVEEWNDDLDQRPVTQTAIDWLDDVVTFGFDTKPRPHFTLWFDLSVDWPSSLAGHWIRGAFALARLTLDDRLAGVGWKVRQRDDDPPMPSIESQFHRPDPSGHTLRFEIDGAVAHLADETVYMEARLDGERVDTPKVALAMLPEEEQTRIREVLEAKRCACPLCRVAWGNYSLPEIGGRNGLTGEHVLRWPSTATWRYVASPNITGNALWISDDAYGGPRAYVTWDAGRRFELVERFDDGARPDAMGKPHVHAIPVGRGFLLVQGRTWLRTTNGGRHFARIEGPPGVCGGLVSRGKTIVAWCNESSGAFVYRSANGGKTWRRVASAPIIDHVALGTRRTYAVAREAIDGPTFLAWSDDGKRWSHTRALPLEAKQILVGGRDDTLVVVGTWRGVSSAAGSIRSTDGGRTWKRGPKAPASEHQAAFAHPSGRWFHVASSGQFLQCSDDEGATWRDASDEQPQSLAVDPTRARAIFVGGYDRLARLSW